jgi:hypothetical protein
MEARFWWPLRPDVDGGMLRARFAGGNALTETRYKNFCWKTA